MIKEHYSKNNNPISIRERSNKIKDGSFKGKPEKGIFGRSRLERGEIIRGRRRIEGP